MEKITLANDHLNRGKYALTLFNIISDYRTNAYHGNPNKKLTNTDNQAFVMAISAPWGYGKTYFVDLFEKVLQKESQCITSGAEYFNACLFYEKSHIIHYDAWKNDFWQNAFEPLFDYITSIDLYKSANDDDLKKASKALSYCGAAISYFIKTLASTKDSTKVIADMINDLNDAGGDLSKVIEKAEGIDKFTDYTLFKKSLNQLKNSLAKIIEKTGDIIIVIDELDRCKPTFAVQTLEIVKHLFNVKGITFIFSLDIIQLRHCVKVIYGNDFDAVGYLERFFDYISLMPQGNRESLFELIANDFEIDITDIEQKQTYLQIIEEFHLSIREIRALCATFRYLTKFELNGYPKHALQLYFYLTALKYKEPVSVIEAISNSNRAESIRSELIRNYKPVFNPITAGAVRCFIEVFKENAIIGQYSDFHYIDSNGNPSFWDSYRLQIIDNGLSFVHNTDQSEIVNLTKGSISFVLFEKDLLNSNLQKMTILEYLFGKVEMYHSALQNDV